MTKITPLQESLYDIVPTIHPQEKTNNLRNFVHKKGLFTGQTQLSDEVIKTLLLEPISDPDTKKELSNILSASTNLSALEQLITNHKDNIQHLLYGYKKLKNVLKIEQEIKEQQIAQDQLSMSQYII
ncbi:hypothetical protein FACS189428_3720 [Clostridia bacterium]|nr:hypothetical protein FACS189428_3720 [Clostridia bacterium]